MEGAVEPAAGDGRGGNAAATDEVLVLSGPVLFDFDILASGFVLHTLRLLVVT